MPAGIQLTTPLIWACTACVAVLDVSLALLLSRTINREQFREQRKLLILAGGVFFLLVWTSVLVWGWDWFYAYIFPAWARYALPPIFGTGYALLALGMAWLSINVKGNPVITWCVLGGVEGLLSHLYAIYELGAASKPPIMQGTDPFAVLVFAIFEKAFYWSLILLVSWLISKKYFQRANLKM